MFAFVSLTLLSLQRLAAGDDIRKDFNFAVTVVRIVDIICANIFFHIYTYFRCIDCESLVYAPQKTDMQEEMATDAQESAVTCIEKCQNNYEVCVISDADVYDNVHWSRRCYACQEVQIE